MKDENPETRFWLSIKFRTELHGQLGDFTALSGCEIFSKEVQRRRVGFSKRERKRIGHGNRNTVS